MKEKILALLLAKFAGVRKDGLAQLAASLTLQAADETEATALVDKITADKVNDFVKDWRKDVDKEVSEGNKTYKKTLEEKFDLIEKKHTDTKPADPKPGDDIATIVANAVKAAVEPLQQRLSSFEGSKITETRLQAIEGKFAVLPSDSKIAEAFKSQKLKDFKRMNFESDDAFNEYLNEVDTDITGLTQEIADSGLLSHSKPLFSQQNKEGVSSAVASFIADTTSDKKPLSGKEI